MLCISIKLDVLYKKVALRVSGRVSVCTKENCVSGLTLQMRKPMLKAKNWEGWIIIAIIADLAWGSM